MGLRRLGRTVSERAPNNDQARFFYYDAAGKLTQKVDRNDRKIVYTYDRLNRMTKEQWYSNLTTGTVNKTITNTYDLLSRLTATTDKNSSNAAASADYMYTYDVGDRVTGSTITIAGLTPVTTYIQDTEVAPNFRTLQVLGLAVRLQHQGVCRGEEIDSQEAWCASFVR